ncbi:hypothetical protein F8388_021020 [Cannabis sativa]|uniref:non-specific serine/threonine protein kinase n=1 Tax=Cannabis sativa TaxID=3483 RepID=A0A7J6DTM4_CANSA|nr:hypothetical protein F8388_021020 [Cannabis sativa]
MASSQQFSQAVLCYHLKFFFFFFFFFLAPFLCEALGRPLPPEEVEAIREIAAQLKKKDWDLNDPCNNVTTITDKPRSDKYTNVIVCNCSIFSSNEYCHLQSFNFTGQDLDGKLPSSLWKLPHLKAINLERNFLSGPIPREWNLSKLEILSISANNIHGPIPPYLGQITTLKYLGMETNMLFGTIPSELGNLVNLEYLNLNANNLTGQFPLALTNLPKLTTLRISSNYFTGKMPEFGGWKQLQYLEMEASGFDGPIPSSLSSLNNLTEIRITDLNGQNSSNFPDLRNMTNLKKLMMRSCNLRGNIPTHINTFEKLVVLDLSFNKLQGELPNLDNLAHLSKMYFTTINSKVHLDRKATDHYSLHINCGGKPITIGDIKYEGDDGLVSPSNFVNVGTWGLSNTGDFWDYENKASDYIAATTNVSGLRINNSDFELYTTARVSPLSLTYYAYCLGNGNYTVKLHFAEIVLRQNRSYYSLGRRIFDVYVQGKLELKDFNIEKEANGVDKAVIRVVKQVVVSHNTLEIRLQWTGKGTRNIPKRGIYGSLISAISIDSDFKPPDKNKAKKIIIGVALFLQQKGDIMELVDPNLGSQFKKEEAKRMIKVALLCTNPSPSLRPTMSTVVSILEGRTTIPKLDMALSIDDPFMFTGLRGKVDQISQQTSKTSHSMATQSSNSSSWIDSASASSFSKSSLN